MENALRNLVAPNRNVSDAVDVRQELDLRIGSIESRFVSPNFISIWSASSVFMHSILGAAFTRFQTMRLQKVFPDVLAQQLISYGSCQFPTLGFVVARFKEVQAFVPEPFWKLKGK